MDVEPSPFKNKKTNQERETSCTAGGKVNWYSHCGGQCGGQYGGSLKN